jgi:acetyltransferase-like isoleucine patch superfamily enzyme
MSEYPFYTRDYLKDWDGGVIGEYTYGIPEILYWRKDIKLIIGKFCSIGHDVKIILGGNHRPDWVTTYPFPALNGYWPEAQDIKGHPTTKGDVVIGNDVWICDRVTILSGINIGDGAVIGAGTVVSKDIEPYSIVIGNPAREIRKRFSQDIISKLLQIKWWNWPLGEIRDNIKLLCSPPERNMT